MADNDYDSFFGFILGALMAAALCGVMLVATENLVLNSSDMKIKSPIISAVKIIPSNGLREAAP